MIDDKKMRTKIDHVLNKHRARGVASKAAQLAAAVGASSKMLAGCIVVEYGVPDPATSDAAVVDSAMGDASDAGGIDLATTAEYAAPFDASGFDAGVVAEYAAPFDAGSFDTGIVADYAAPFDAGNIQPLYGIESPDASALDIGADDAGVVALYGIQVPDAGATVDAKLDDVGAVAMYGIAAPDSGAGDDVIATPMYGISAIDGG